jgi:zinc/manganese transport system substrate-binding protein
LSVQPGSTIAGAVVVAVLLGSLGVYAAWTAPTPTGFTNGVVSIVAAENFWGSLAAQIGGSHVHVLSIVTDPNVDPHEYETNASAARAIATARLVIVNGAGYDQWATQMISAAETPNQVVLNVAALLGQAPGANPHFWYSPTYVNATVRQMYVDLVSIDPADATYYAQQYAAVRASLISVDDRIAQIHHQFAGTQVASTESIFVYLANATGLDLVSPSSFMNAVSEGVDPPSSSVAEFQDQLESGTVHVLVYNLQTVTPLTQQMEEIATEYHVPLVPVTETIQPPNVPYQTWMTSELLGLQNALIQAALA